MKNKKICRYCGKEIDVDRDKLVLLGTYEERSSLDESYFHYDCFVDWFNEKVKDQASSIEHKPQKEKVGVGLQGGLGMGKVDPQMQAMVGDIVGLAEGLLGGLDIGIIDVKKEAQGMTSGINNLAGKLGGKMEKKKNEESKKKTSAKKKQSPQ